MSVSTLESFPVLRLMEARGVGNATLRAILHRLREEGGALSDLAEMGAAEIVRHFGLKQSLEEAIQEAESHARETAQQLDAAGIELLVHGFPGYPKILAGTLGDKAPPILFAAGDLGLAEVTAVAFCGSRQASETGVRVAAESSSMLADQGVAVISGYARGVDLAAHRAALERDGGTVLVLAEGILNFRVKKAVQDVWDQGRHLILSEFHPRAKWRAPAAMQRNRTICALADALVVIESGLRGGTFNAGETAIELGRPLFVAEYADPAPSAEGNRYFLDRGAISLRGDKSGRPNLRKLLAAVRMSMHESKTDMHDHATEEASATQEAPDTGAAHVEESEAAPTDPSPDTSYPKRLIEVDLPIGRISAHARREKSIRHGHISTLHIWWARRPLAACRAVVCAALWPDPVDENCPDSFREAAARQITEFARRVYAEKLTEEGKQLQETASQESLARWEGIVASGVPFDTADPEHRFALRNALLDFIGDFANWDNSTVPAYLETSRALTQAAHEALGGMEGTRPMVVDPFAGGGSIPLEALRVGADTFASDLNPVAVLLNKVLLEYIPKYGQRLADEVRKWGHWVGEQAEQELAEFYPQSTHGGQPLAYVWARTILSEAPDGSDFPVELPLLRSMWLAKNSSSDRALRWSRDSNGRVRAQEVEVTYADGTTSTVRRPLLELFEPQSPSQVEAGTVARGNATCPVTGHVTRLSSIRRQLQPRRGGASDARLLAVRETIPPANDRTYREPENSDFEAIRKACAALRGILATQNGSRLIPQEPTPKGGGKGAGRAFSQRKYGMDTFSDLFTPRQLVSITTVARLITEARENFEESHEKNFINATETCLALALSRFTDFCSSLCVLKAAGNRGVVHTFGRQVIPVVWDFAETNPLNLTSAGWANMVEYFSKTLEQQTAIDAVGQVQSCNAADHPLPDEIADVFITDPPYYDSVPYADLSDYFYVWIKRAAPASVSFEDETTPKEYECIVDDGNGKDEKFFETTLAAALQEGRRVLKSSGLGVVVFAHKTTAGWESICQAMIDAGWVILGSWPIDTEQPTRLRARESAALASSIHLVCRPRESPDGSLRENVGEWREVLAELPGRIHEWMPRLAREGIVGADAIFACLGPALEIFSRYSRVERANGEEVTLREYLEHVWGAVSTEALSMMFEDADAAGLEPDARLTAMWLWTLGAGVQNGNGKDNGGEKVKASTGYSLEYDAARKIAQGLGVHLEECDSFVEVKGSKARLLPVSERTRYLFGQNEGSPAAGRRRGRKAKQRNLFEEMDEIEEEAGPGQLGSPTANTTVLDRVHQAMLLFASGRGEALKRFLLEDGTGKDSRFWALAQTLSYLYPHETDEKRWVDGVLARKKGLGL